MTIRDKIAGCKAHI